MSKYKDNYTVPVEIIDGKEYTIIQPDKGILYARRNQLGLTQQEVAKRSGINLRQYTRLESGERTMAGVSLRIGLAICDTLQLDPHRFV